MAHLGGPHTYVEYNPETGTVLEALNEVRINNIRETQLNGGIEVFGNLQIADTKGLFTNVLEETTPGSGVSINSGLKVDSIEPNGTGHVYIPLLQTDGTVVASESIINFSCDTISTISGPDIIINDPIKVNTIGGATQPTVDIAEIKTNCLESLAGGNFIEVEGTGLGIALGQNLKCRDIQSWSLTPADPNNVINLDTEDVEVRAGGKLQSDTVNVNVLESRTQNHIAVESNLVVETGHVFQTDSINPTTTQDVAMEGNFIYGLNRGYGWSLGSGPTGAEIGSWEVIHHCMLNQFSGKKTVSYANKQHLSNTSTMDIYYLVEDFAASGQEVHQRVTLWFDPTPLTVSVTAAKEFIISAGSELPLILSPNTTNPMMFSAVSGDGDEPDFKVAITIASNGVIQWWLEAADQGFRSNTQIDIGQSFTPPRTSVTYLTSNIFTRP